MAYTSAAIDYMLGVWINGDTPITTWYIGLITNLSTVRASDTLSSHTGWDEFTSYRALNNVRPLAQWGISANGAVVGPTGSSSLSTPFPLPISEHGVIQGLFLTDAATGTTGLLLYTHPFTLTQFGQVADEVVFPGSILWVSRGSVTISTAVRNQIPTL